MLVEWSDLRETDTDADIPPVSFPHRAEMTAQLLEVSGTTPSVRPEYSLNLSSEETPQVWGGCNNPQGAPISLKSAGEGSTILESGQLARLRVDSGTGVVARGRIKFTRIAAA